MAFALDPVLFNNLNTLYNNVTQNGPLTPFGSQFNCIFESALEECFQQNKFPPLFEKLLEEKICTDETKEVFLRIYKKIRKTWEKHFSSDDNPQTLVRLFERSVNDYRALMNTLKEAVVRGEESPQKVSLIAECIAFEQAVACNLKELASQCRFDKEEKEAKLYSMFQEKSDRAVQDIAAFEAKKASIELVQALNELENHPVKYFWIQAAPGYFYMHSILEIVVSRLNRCIPDSLLSTLPGGADIKEIMKKINVLWVEYSNQEAYKETENAIETVQKMLSKIVFPSLTTVNNNLTRHREQFLVETLRVLNKFFIDEEDAPYTRDEVEHCFNSMPNEKAKIFMDRALSLLRKGLEEEAQDDDLEFKDLREKKIQQGTFQALVLWIDKLRPTEVLNLRYSKSFYDVLETRYDDIDLLIEELIAQLSANNAPFPQAIARDLNAAMGCIKTMFAKKPASVGLTELLEAKGYTNIRNVQRSGYEGEIWLAAKDKKQYAVKVYKNVAADLRKFQNWIKRNKGDAARVGLSHPHLLPIQEVATDQEKIVAAIFPYMEGGDLSDFCVGKGDAKMLPGYFTQILKCLQYLHEQGYIHYDVKLDNVLLSKDLSTAKLCDFGFLTKLAPDGKSTFVFGTQLYMAPEIYQEHTSQVDIWSFGVLAFSALTGVFPFKSEETEYGSFVKISGEIIQNALNLIKCPVARSFVQGCLAMNPGQRFTAAQALEHDFLRR